MQPETLETLPGLPPATAPAPAYERTPSLLIVEDDQAMQQMCVQLFQRRGYRVEGCSAAEEALTRVGAASAENPIDLVLSDVRLGRDRADSGIQLLRQIKALRPEMPVLLMTGYATVQDAVEAMKLGAADYVTKPFERAELLNKVEAQLKVRALETEVKALREALDERYGIKGLIGASVSMRAVCDRIEAAGRSQATVLITGESGTGKELVARAIHMKSARRDKPFIPVNCAALPENLIESELFGHEPGAFTGAAKEGLGLFRAANSGTIFLDEVADMPKDVQAKLLRVLQDHRVRPVGSTKETPVDVRVIAATNWDVEKARGEGVLRDDLYFRLSVIRIILPPLRERLDDLSLLIQHFMAKHAKSAGRRLRRVAPDAFNAMLAYSWPGNVRELESVIESAYALGSDETLKLEDLPPHVTSSRDTPVSTVLPVPAVASAPVGQALPPAPAGGIYTLDAMEKDALLRALQIAHGNKSKAAQLLGVSRKRLYRMLYDFGLSTESPAENG
ncbi:MAG TPA: sigma-54 dependent transcriptional regulator [Planctomycetota bacterium]|nr:sigma-54 dependent transcriptional regulator [Planctomycetota bacterium]